jgi:preprotein translocase subunit YajC
LFDEKGFVVMRLVVPVLSVALLAVIYPAPVLTQAAAQPAATTAPTITTGMVIKDPQGGTIGTVIAVAGDLLTVKTDKHEAQLPRASFAVSGRELLLGMTQQQLDTAIEQELAAAQAKITQGVEVVGLNGGPVGTIESIDDQYAAVKLTSGKLIRLQRNALAPAPQGARIGMTAAALEAQVAATAPAGPTATHATATAAE